MMISITALGLLTMVLALNVTPGQNAPPIPGATCGGADHTLGETWPPNETRMAIQDDDIVNIKALSTTSDGDVFGWIYVARNRHAYVEGRNDSQSWNAVANALNDRNVRVSTSAGELFPLSDESFHVLDETLIRRKAKIVECFSGALGLHE